LITNDDSLPELEMLLAYKSQPSLEKRLSHLKTDFEVAPRRSGTTGGDEKPGAVSGAEAR
jgi:hypothetical protein